MISILIIEDHILVRESWKEVLSSFSNYKVIAESEAIDDAFNKIISLHPDVILMDIHLRGENTIELIKKICNVMPNPKIIVVSMNNEFSFIKKMFSLGVKGYVTKYSPKSDFVESIERVYSGETYFCSKVKELFLEGKDDTKLSFRELEIIKLITKGCSNKDIAGHLNLSVKSIEATKTKIYKKLSLKSTAELVGYANSKGIEF